MTATSARCNSGFTLVEVMVAIVIMAVFMLGLLEALEVAMQNNTKNLIRDDVAKVAQDTMNNMKDQPFNAAFTPTTTVTTNLRGVQKQYNVQRTVTTLPSGALTYQVGVKWVFKGVTTTYTVVSMRGNE